MRNFMREGFAAFLRSFKSRALWFILFDVVLILLLYFFPFMLAALVESDPAYIFASNNNPASLNVATIPDNIDTMLLLFLAKVFLLFTAFAVFVVAFYLFAQVVGWNLYYKHEKLFSRARLFTKLFFLWLLIGFAPFVVVFVLVSLAAYALVTVIQNPVLSWGSFILAWLLVLWFVHCTTVLQCTVFRKDASISKSLQAVVRVGLQRFHRYVLFYVVMFIVTIVLASSFAYFFTGEQARLYISLGVTVLFFAWVRSFVAQVLVVKKQKK